MPYYAVMLVNVLYSIKKHKITHRHTHTRINTHNKKKKELKSIYIVFFDTHHLFIYLFFVFINISICAQNHRDPFDFSHLKPLNFKVIFFVKIVASNEKFYQKKCQVMISRNARFYSFSDISTKKKEIKLAKKNLNNAHLSILWRY
uniref:Uncharacterized protein n=1 Tax=Glossina pallidipes TaxID=7398 RepID=A0A1A9ZB50_GLOPL